MTGQFHFQFYERFFYMLLPYARSIDRKTLRLIQIRYLFFQSATLNAFGLVCSGHNLQTELAEMPLVSEAIQKMANFYPDLVLFHDTHEIYDDHKTQIGIDDYGK